MPKFTRNTMAMNMDCLEISASDWTCIDMLGIASCLQKLSKPFDYSIGKHGGSLVSSALRLRSHYPAFDRLGVAMPFVSENTRLYKMLAITS